MISARESMKKELYQAQAHLTRVHTALARLPEEFDYPLCFESIPDGDIVVFAGIETGTVIELGQSEMGEIGVTSDDWIDHTDSAVWKPIAFNKKRGLYDKQLVWGTYNNSKGMPLLLFYDAINDCPFLGNGYRDGYRDGFMWDNMSPATVDEPWVKIAYDKLKD